MLIYSISTCLFNRSAVTGEATSWVPSPQHALPRSRRLKPRNWPPSWAELLAKSLVFNRKIKKIQKETWFGCHIILRTPWMTKSVMQQNPREEGSCSGLKLVVLQWIIFLDWGLIHRGQLRNRRWVLTKAVCTILCKGWNPAIYTSSIVCVQLQH